MADVSNERLGKRVDRVNDRTQRILDDIQSLKNVVTELEVRYKKLSVSVAELRNKK